MVVEEGLLDVRFGKDSGWTWRAGLGLAVALVLAVASAGATGLSLADPIESPSPRDPSSLASASSLLAGVPPQEHSQGHLLPDLETRAAALGQLTLSTEVATTTPTPIAPASPTALNSAPSLALVTEAASPLSISAGNSHSCGVTYIGAAKCWGSNFNGELGSGTNTSTNIPGAVVGLGSGVLAVTAGGSHSCALTSAGDLRCWGSNAYGQLGNGKAGVDSNVPVPVIWLQGSIIAVAAGRNHTCAVKETGAVVCWGDNQYGQLGTGTTTASDQPVQVFGLDTGASAIAAGFRHTCAVVNSEAKCWGANETGQLGDGATGASSLTPASVSGLGSNVSAIAAGSGHSCAIAGGAAVCWGSNRWGQLGSGTDTDSAVPVATTGLRGTVDALAAGANHTCAVANTAMHCSGVNTYGQLGNGTNTRSNVLAVVAGLGSGVRTIAAGTSHTIAVTDSGDSRGWGWNFSGQLGNGTNTDTTLPVRVLLPSPTPTATTTPTSTPASALSLPAIFAGGGTPGPEGQ